MKRLLVLFLMAVPMAAHAAKCPPAPEGMGYKHVGDESTEASMNGAPSVQCIHSVDTISLFGEGNSFEAWVCPTFSLVHKGIGGTAEMKIILDKDYGPPLREEWYVLDKNKRKWMIWSQNPEIKNKRFAMGNELVDQRSERAIANGCSHTRQIKVIAKGIDLVVRTRHTTRLSRLPVPAF